MNLLVSIAAPGFSLLLSVREGRPNLQMAKLSVVFIAIGMLTSGFRTIPLAEYGGLAVRYAGLEQPARLGQAVPYSVHQEYGIQVGMPRRTPNPLESMKLWRSARRGGRGRPARDRDALSPPGA
jgi:hypothetical protein